MAGKIPDDVRARIAGVCEEAISPANKSALEAWRETVDGATDADGALTVNANRTADKPRELIEELKNQMLQEHQEQLLLIIRSTPGWGEAEIGHTGYLHVHDTPIDLGVAAESTAQEQRMALMFGKCGQALGGDAGIKDLEGRQAWRERYVVLTPGTIECYRETVDVGGGEGSSGRRGKKKLTRTIHRKLSDLVRWRPYVPPGFAPASAEQARGRFLTEDEQADSPFIELTFTNPHDTWKMDSLYLQAATPEKAAVWLRLIKENRETAVDTTSRVLGDDAERAQRLLDELEDAFAGASPHHAPAPL